jgi:acyl phosphate:glycerol-3-phosphate acyltransferase
MSIWQIVCVCIASYLIGSISASYLIGKWVFGIDIRQHGSGNAGATNTLRVIGVKAGILVLVFDACKGILTVLLALVFTHHSISIMALAGFCTIVGHNWPVYFGFRGGKGIATSIGVIATLGFLPALCAGAIAILLLIITRIVSLASLTFTTLVPVFMLIMHSPSSIFVLTVCLALLSYWRHRLNIVRLVKRQEHRLFSDKTNH